jgi:hypothetical protein
VISYIQSVYEGVSKSFRTGRLGRELQMVQLSATRCSCIAILWVSLLSFAAITLCVASRVFIIIIIIIIIIVVVVYFVIVSVRKLLDIPSYRPNGSQTVINGNKIRKNSCPWLKNHSWPLSPSSTFISTILARILNGQRTEYVIRLGMERKFSNRTQIFA